MEFQRYFQAYEDYFWVVKAYRDDFGESHFIYEVPFGSTIAYTHYIVEVLQFLSDDSIPPLGSLLLAVLATNPESNDSIEGIQNYLKSKEKNNSFPNTNSFRTGVVTEFLQLLASLPEEFKKGEKRLHLFQTLFHNCHNRVSAEKAKILIQDFKENEYSFCSNSSAMAFNEANFIKDIRTIALLKTKFPTVQSILNAIESLPDEDVSDRLTDEVFEEDSLSDAPADFVQQLIDEDKTFQVGSLIKHIWSGLNIPLHHNVPSEQPLGGVSDLTNKGDFDKLLISEFAHDDDVFMSRIANHEALYIQREVPPEADKFMRILLIDSTLKNWGNPKILGFASALAIAKHPKTDIECSVFVVGDQFKEVQYENVYQVINGISELSGKLDCADGLNRYFTENKINTKSQEIFLITSNDSLKLAPMQRVMSENFDAIKYVFATDAAGELSIFRNQNKGKKLLQQIVLPLDELWVKDTSGRHLSRSGITEGSIPLLYPSERNYQYIFRDGSDFYMYSNGNLLLFPKDGFSKGFDKIASNLPFYNGEYAVKSNKKGEKVLLHYAYSSHEEITLLNLKTKEYKRHKIFGSDFRNKNLTFFGFEDDFYVTDNAEFWQISKDLKVTKCTSDKIKATFDDYFNERSLFIQNYKRSKPKYTVIKRMETVVIDENEFRINGYTLYHGEFVALNEYYARNFLTENKQMIRFTCKVNLILKRKGNRPLELVKLIKEHANKSLKDAKSIVDGHLEVILNNVSLDEANYLKVILEKNGAVCYTEPTSFESEDGSSIVNQNGILIFKSSNDQIPEFYIPFVTKTKTIMATATEYTGNSFFLPEESLLENTEIDDFKEKYINPFISNIVKYGT